MEKELTLAQATKNLMKAEKRMAKLQAQKETKLAKVLATFNEKFSAKLTKADMNLNEAKNNIRAILDSIK